MRFRGLIVVACLLCAVYGCSDGNLSSGSEQRVITKDPLLGFGVSPRHSPRHTGEDLDEFFDLASKKGSFIVFITQWSQPASTKIISILSEMAHRRGLKFYLQLSPTKLDTKRDAADVPAELAGRGFSDPYVRAAYKQKCLEFAATNPDQLCLATEINFLSANPRELDAFVSLYKETYAELKRAYPRLLLTVSFQYDMLRAGNGWAILKRFQPIDVVSFTSYPYVACNDVSKLPVDYYDGARTHVPAATPIGFSELGWSSDIGGQAGQSGFCRLLPVLFRKARPQFVSHALMFDVTVFGGELAVLNHVGLFTNDGNAKASWGIVARQQIR